jgi:LemA protein
MNKNLITFALIGGLTFFFGVLGITGCSSYNSMVEKQETVETSWSQVMNVYQRRADLIPNLVNTVKGMSNYEQSTLTAVTSAQMGVSRIKADESTYKDADKLQSYMQAQNQLSMAVRPFMTMVQQMPNLQANQGFMQLMEQLEGTENRVSTERSKFIASVQEYNTYIRKMPNTLFAGMFGFAKMKNFEADQKAQTAPEVKF